MIPSVSCVGWDTKGNISFMKKGPNIKGLKPKKEYEIFARNMKFLREREGWTFEEAADKYGVTKGQVQKYEWALNMPKPLRILKIAKLYGLPYEELIGEEKIFDSEGKGGKTKSME